MNKKFLSLLLVPFLLSAGPKKEPSLTDITLQEVSRIESALVGGYAPIEWRRQKFGLDIPRLAEKSRFDLLKNPACNVQEARLRLTNMVRDLGDYSSFILFISSEAAWLPFTLKEINSRFYVADVQEGFYGLQPGDELLTWNNQPIYLAIQEMAALIGRKTNPIADRSLACQFLPFRVGLLGMEVPKGNVQIGFKQRRSNSIRSMVLSWQRMEEYLNPPFIFKTVAKAELIHEVTTFGESKNLHDVKSRVSLEDAAWKTKTDEFSAAIFEGPVGEKIGFLRFGDEDDLDELDTVIQKLERETDLLVLDFMGLEESVTSRMGDLLNRFASYPLQLLQQRTTLTQADVIKALGLMAIFDSGDIHQYLQWLVAQWNSGKVLTDLHYENGKRELTAEAGDAVYTKPILILVDENTAGNFELMAAILQINGRARLMGQKTRGACSDMTALIDFPNRLGIFALIYPKTIYYTPQNVPIDGIGLTPDRFCPLTVDDLVFGGVDFKKKIFEEAEQMLYP